MNAGFSNMPEKLTLTQLPIFSIGTPSFNQLEKEIS